MAAIVALLSAWVGIAAGAGAFLGYGLAFGIFWFVGSVAMGFLCDRSEVALVVLSVAAQLAALPLFLAAKRAPDPA